MAHSTADSVAYSFAIEVSTVFGSPASLSAPGAADQHPGGVALDDHVGDQLLDELEAGDRDAELLALGRVGDRGVDAAVADPDAAGGDPVAARVERAHRDLEAVADLAEHRVVADLDAVERDLGGVGGAQAELAVDLLRGVALAVGRDEEAGEALGAPCSGSVWAKISATSAKLPSEIHIFLPVIAQPPSIFSARVRRMAASEPVSGSVRPKQPSASPEHRRGSQRCFCSSVPQRSIEPQTSEVWTETTVRAEESARPTCSTIRP